MVSQIEPWPFQAYDVTRSSHQTWKDFTACTYPELRPRVQSPITSAQSSMARRPSISAYRCHHTEPCRVLILLGVNRHVAVVGCLWPSLTIIGFTKSTTPQLGISKLHKVADALMDLLVLHLHSPHYWTPWTSSAGVAASTMVPLRPTL
jgi:hypothetical protein